MSTNSELWWLTATILLTGTIWVPIILYRIREHGLWVAVRNPHHDERPKTPWADRLMWAHANGVENLVIFAPLVITADVLGVSTTGTAFAAVLYFFARLAHAIVYALAIPVLRTLAFVAGFAAQMTFGLAILGALSLGVENKSPNQQLATHKEAKALFDSAMAYLDANGLAAAYAAFNEPHGKFLDRDLYVFCLDFDRTWKAMGANPSLVGRSAEGMRDLRGKDFVGEFVEIARTTGSGTSSYFYKNPVSGNETAKTSFIRRVSEDEFCGVGYYR